MLSLETTSGNTVYYIYVLADPAPGRSPRTIDNAQGHGSAKKGFDDKTRGAFSGGVFLGRSGPLLVQHPPEFVVVGWDYDDDTGNNFSTTKTIQVPSDIPGMAVVAANRKDNRNITVDTGAFVGKGDAIGSLNSGNAPDPVSTVDLLFWAQDVDNPGDFKMTIFLSTTSNLGAGDLVGTGIDSLANAIRFSGTDTLKIGDHIYTFDPVDKDPATTLVGSFVPEGKYFVYFAATDGEDGHRVVAQVLNDPFVSSPTPAVLQVRHSPNLTLDSFSLNDFEGDGDLDVITGIDVSQMQSDLDGKDLIPGPARRSVTFSWGGTGLEGDLDIDDNATIDFYYSTRSDFRDVRGSVAYTSGNSDGRDLLESRKESDTHRIVSGIEEDPDGLYDNLFVWDIWTYVSPNEGGGINGGTIPLTSVRYYVYAIMKGRDNTRLVSFTNEGAVQFQHPPYIRPIEPSRDITVSIHESALVSWEAVDVDNGGIAGVAVPVRGQEAVNDRNVSPNIRILLTSADFGKVTTWGTITSGNTVHRFWVGNSGDGSLAEEIELNEGVDTSFVILGDRMRNNLVAGASSGGLELQTHNGVGETYFVYLAIDGGLDGTVGDQPVNFSAFSPVVRAPGKVTFTGVVSPIPSTSSRFLVAKEITAVVDQVIKYPITPEVSPAGRSIETVDIFITLDPNLFEEVDTNPNVPGIQPFSLGANSQLDTGNVQQAAYIQDGKLRLDFIYDAGTFSGVTFFDGKQPLTFANFRAKPLSGGTVGTTISLDNSGNRITKMLNGGSNIVAAVPQPTSVEIVRRSQVSGTVPLQGRATSADSVTFFLRAVGALNMVSDSLFSLNDQDRDGRPGVQVLTTGVGGSFTLSNVSSGRWVLTAGALRHLTGHDTLEVLPGQDLSGVQPTLDGDGVDRTQLLGGDAAGYTDSSGASIPDNFIDAADINAINDALFTQFGETDYNTFADINQDSVVNGTDKDFTAANQTSNTGSAGRLRPVFPTFKRADPEGNNTEALVVLAGLPEGEIRAGQSFDVAVEISGARAVRTYEVHLTYDSTRIVVEDIVSNGSLFENYPADMSGKAQDGEVGFVSSILGRTRVGASGEGVLAIVRFRAISRAAQTRLELSDVLLIDVEHVVARPKFSGGATVVLSKAPILYHDSEGSEIRGLILAEADPEVGFNDFLVLARHFGTRAGDADFDLRADLNADDRADFADFLIFTRDFGKVAVDAPTSRRVGKRASPPGANREAKVSLKADGKTGNGRTLDVTVYRVQSHSMIVNPFERFVKLTSD